MVQVFKIGYFLVSVETQASFFLACDFLSKSEIYNRKDKYKNNLKS